MCWAACGYQLPEQEVQSDKYQQLDGLVRWPLRVRKYEYLLGNMWQSNSQKSQRKITAQVQNKTYGWIWHQVSKHIAS
jgi:hypothetical protein